MANQFSKTELNKLKETLLIIKKYKFSNVFGDISGSLQRVIDIIEISAHQKNNDKYDFISLEKIPQTKGSEYLVPIIEAIKEQRTIRLYYHPFYEDKPYFTDIHPYLLKEYKNRWYLIGLNDFKNQLRTYSLDRIRDIQMSSVKYMKSNFNASNYFKNSIGVISPEGEPVKLKIAVQKTQAQYIISQAWHESQNIESEDDEEVIFSFRVHPTYEFISLLLSYGKDLRVVEPASLKEKMIGELRAAIEKY